MTTKTKKTSTEPKAAVVIKEAVDAKTAMRNKGSEDFKLMKSTMTIARWRKHEDKFLVSLSKEAVLSLSSALVWVEDTKGKFSPVLLDEKVTSVEVGSTTYNLYTFTNLTERVW